MRRDAEAEDSPEIRRRKSGKKKLWVFLMPKLWEELAFAARFATRVFALTGKPETTSRNDFIEDSLIWALAAYWKGKGGKPLTEEEFEERALAAAEKLKAREAKLDQQ